MSDLRNRFDRFTDDQLKVRVVFWVLSVWVQGILIGFLLAHLLLRLGIT